MRAVDQDVADRRVLEQQLERAEAERLVEHLVDEPLALAAVEQRVFGVAQVLDDQADLAAQRVAFQVADARQVELVDQLAVDAPLELFELGFLDPSAIGGRCVGEFGHGVVPSSTASDASGARSVGAGICSQVRAMRQAPTECARQKHSSQFAAS